MYHFECNAAVTKIKLIIRLRMVTVRCLWTYSLHREYTVPTLDCIPIEGLEPPISRDTTFTSFLGGPHTTMANGTVTFSQTNGTKDPS